MYKISGRTVPILLGRRFLIDLCHPTFAMTGALAWQVNYVHEKKNGFFGFEEGSHGDCPGFLLYGVCRFLSSFISVHIMCCCPQLLASSGIARSIVLAQPVLVSRDRE